LPSTASKKKFVEVLVYSMKIGKQEKSQIFNGISPYGVTTAIESNVLLNKAMFDVVGSDVPWIIMANNKEERRERINRGLLSVLMVFVSPLVALPFVNRFAMKNVAKLTPKLFSKQYNAVKLSNEHLVNAEKTKAGLKKLSEELKIDFTPTIQKAGGDFEKIRKKIVDAKNIVLGFDVMMVAGVFGHIGFYNNRQTKKKTGQIGFSAELEMADKSVVEKRAKRQEQLKKIKYNAFLATLAAASIGMPLAVRHGMRSNKNTKFANYIKSHGKTFDYKDAIFMSRWPMAISFVAAHTGVFLASRNKSEMKDNAIRSTTSISIFFVGDLLLASVLGQISDKLLKTKIINKNPEHKNILNKILPPAKTLKSLENINHPRTKNVAAAIFWFNFAALSALMGFAVPTLINKMVKKDVSKDAEKPDFQK